MNAGEKVCHGNHSNCCVLCSNSITDPRELLCFSDLSCTLQSKAFRVSGSVLLRAEEGLLVEKKNSLCALTIFHKNGRRILKVYSFSVHETGSDQSHRTHLGLSGVIKIATTYETKQCQMLIEELKLLWCFLQLCQQQFMINETCRP